MEKKFVYAVVATFELDSAMMLTEMLGIFESQVKAFKTIEEYDFMKVFSEEIIEPVTPGYKSRSFGTDAAGATYYEETTYVNTASDEMVNVGSVSIIIFQKEVE